MQERMPTEQEWDEWKQHPCSKLLVKWAERERLEKMEMWADGHFTAAFDMEMAVKNAGATGACSIYKEIMELDYNQIAGVNDAESVGPDPRGISGTS